MYTYNLFKRPIGRSTWEAWAKQSEDVGRVAFIAFFAMIFSDYDLFEKLSNLMGLFSVGYIFMLAGRNIRIHLEHTKEE